ncbi:MAG: ABC-F type ribosomal protection protein [Clostridioides sp.]|jgi:lincosamide and streptogramin A transport system ATP-binding/permease protein|nr:ABC-F type ribosomal protection protein [Clostridioides sp.]
MSTISVKNLTFAYDGTADNVFENVSFTIDTAWKLGFVGRNGRGKTTFLKLLMGELDSNNSIKSDINFAYFPYEVSDKTLDTIVIAEQINPYLQEWQLFKELSLLDVDSEVLYRPFSTLSQGEQTKVMIAILFIGEHNFLLIDEPTNHLDSDARRTLGRYLKSKSGFILVSHDRELLDNVCDHILTINKMNIEVQQGNFSSWEENKRRQDEFEFAENEKLKKDIKKLSVAARRTSDWSDKLEKTKYGTTNSGSFVDRGYVGHKSAKMMQSAKNIERRQKKAIEEKSGLLKNIEYDYDLKITPLRYHHETLISIKNLVIQYEEKENVVCENVNFDIKRGDRIALVGKNGSGKSSILKWIIENANKNLKISYVSQDTSDLCGNLCDYANRYGISESLFKATLRKLDFDRKQFDKDIADFSSGQKKKVLIARSLCEQAHLYIWDEPLNFIDVLTRIQIERLLENADITMIFVEHDKKFCKKIENKRVNI